MWVWMGLCYLCGCHCVRSGCKIHEALFTLFQAYKKLQLDYTFTVLSVFSSIMLLCYDNNRCGCVVTQCFLEITRDKCYAWLSPLIIIAESAFSWRGIRHAIALGKNS